MRVYAFGLLVACLPFLAASPAAAAPDWDANLARAARYAETRGGVESFAVVDEAGRMHAWGGRRVYPSASVLKAMLLVAYLERPSVRDRALTAEERGLLEPMIRWSANEPASYLVRLLGPDPLNRLAARAGMTHFRLRSPWGRSEISARSQARFFRRLDRLLPDRHRAYARRLLATVVSSQRWGIPPVKPEGWRIFLKGGWGSGTGWVTHQIAFLERGGRRISLAVLTGSNPSHTYGTDSIRGIAARLLQGL